MKPLSNKGNISILMCGLIVGLMGLVAMVVDVGIVYWEGAKLSNALDAAALAATLELPDKPDRAVAIAREYLERNGIDPNDTIISIGSLQKSIEIEGVSNVKHLFAPIIGINNSDTSKKAKAIIAPAASVSNGIRPFAVEVFDFSYGDVVILKQGAGEGYHGNYGPIALGGTGASNFEANALYGFKGKISVGDFIKTETGNMAGATNSIKNYVSTESSTFNSFSRNSIRLWTIPLVNTLEVNGRGEIQVMGFGQFYVEDVQNKGGKMEVTGRFIRYVINAMVDTDLQDTGTYGGKLSK